MCINYVFLHSKFTSQQYTSPTAVNYNFNVLRYLLYFFCFLVHVHNC